jgi:hypothetical protein
MLCIVKRKEIKSDAMIMSGMTYSIFSISILLQFKLINKKDIVGYIAGEKSRVGEIVLPFRGSGLQADTECLFNPFLIKKKKCFFIDFSGGESES